MTVQRLDKALEWALRLNAIEHMGWREIATLEPFCGKAAGFEKGIPFGSLDSYCHGRPVKNKRHRLILGMPALEPVPVCPVHKVAHVIVHVRYRKPQVITRWRDLPTEELLQALVNRQEF